MDLSPAPYGKNKFSKYECEPIQLSPRIDPGEDFDVKTYVENYVKKQNTVQSVKSSKSP